MDSPAFDSPPAHVVHADIAYLGGPRTEKLDVYVPDADAFPGFRPAVLLIHGGGWRGGDKADARERSIGGTLAAQGYVVFSINYLLNASDCGADGLVRHTRVAWPRNLEDCEAALGWIAEQGGAVGRADAGRVAVMGGSAGGHLAMLLAARHPQRVRAVASLYGIGLIDGARRAAFAGADEEATARRAAEASPIHHVGPRTPPVLLIHGTEDEWVPVEHARWLSAEFARRGVRHRYVEVPGARHSFDLQPEQRDLRPEVLGFLAEHLR